MRKMIYLLLSLVFVSSAYGATIYKWVDKEGAIHFTDDPTKIPSQYRNRVETEEREDSKKVETPAPAPVPTQKSERVRVDRYGQGEDYWKDKVQPWKKQLKEATEKLESTNRQIDNKLEEQSGRFLTPTQVKMKRVEMDQLRADRSRYEDQVKEANEMLKKIAKDAEDAKADPEWVK